MGKPWIPAILMLLLLLPPASGLARDLPHGTWWADPGIADQLQLNPQEVQQLDRLYTESRARMIDIKSAVEGEQRAYQMLLESENLDEAAISRQVQRLEQARSQLSKERAHFMLEVRRILGPKRFQELKAIYQKSR
jgi:Spy/CpxP family protein refolding chaperone